MPNNKSILHQLSKYKQPENSTELTKVNSEVSVKNEETSISKIALALGVPNNALAKVPFGNYANILYPFKLSCLYHAVRNGSYIGGVEKKCDDLIQNFMNEKIRELGREGYLAFFQKAVTPQVKRLIMLRVLVASFGKGSKKMDIIPANLKRPACEQLELSTTINHKIAMGLIEKAYSYASLEDQILGRLGYLLVWKNLCGLDLLALPYNE
tara:strand:+ start:13752 stop:14384 length:633 start_codon:yes stop_codon:yes gene_type:complete